MIIHKYVPSCIYLIHGGPALWVVMSALICNRPHGLHFIGEKVSQSGIHKGRRVHLALTLIMCLQICGMQSADISFMCISISCNNRSCQVFNISSLTPNSTPQYIIEVKKWRFVSISHPFHKADRSIGERRDRSQWLATSQKLK